MNSLEMLGTGLAEASVRFFIIITVKEGLFDWGVAGTVWMIFLLASHKAIESNRDWHCEQVDNLDWKTEFYTIARLTFLAHLPLLRLLRLSFPSQIKFRRVCRIDGEA